MMNPHLIPASNAKTRHPDSPPQLNKEGHKKEGKRTRRLLKGVARRAASELDQLRRISDAPPALNYFYDVMESVFVRNQPDCIFKDGSAGRKTIGVFCMMVPEELIYAAGAVPVRLCAGCYESAQMGEESVPRDGCPLVKSAMGFSAQRGLKAFDLCDVVIMPTTCDAKRKLGEELSVVKEVWMLEVPHIKEAEFARRIWLEQIYSLKTKLEKYTRNGKPFRKITRQGLGDAIVKTARAQFEIRRLLAFRQLPQPVIWGRHAMVVINAYAYGQVEAWTEALIRLNDDLSERATKRQWVCPDARPRILIAGSPAIFPNLKIPTLVEEMGGVVVCDESCAGDRYLYDPVGYTENNLKDQMAGIASRYMSPCVCPSFAPNDDRLFLLKRMVSDYAVDGILYHVLKGCVVYDFEVTRVEKTMREKGIPLLRVETDYNPEDVEQLRTRVEAFVEMLKSKKK